VEGGHSSSSSSAAGLAAFFFFVYKQLYARIVSYYTEAVRITDLGFFFLLLNSNFIRSGLIGVSLFILIRHFLPFCAKKFAYLTCPI
jgi:hypothetical protein